jgi:riboflavin kinase/FMN adenylyltransferase
MKTYSLKEVNPFLFVKPVVTLGVFDGFHLGHQKVVGELVKWAKKIGGESVVLTFRRHPRQILTKEKTRRKEPHFIFTLRHRLLYFARAGVDNCVIVPFTKKFADIPAEEFVRNILVRKIAPFGILMGFDSRFGRDGEGDADLLRRLAPECGFEVRTGRRVKVGKETVGSTLVRTLVASGNIERAARLLGRPVSVLGTVVKGSRRGKTLGFPTANLNLHNETRPPAGVYAGEARINPFSLENSRVYPALINIGARPTFSGKKESVEVHLLGFRGDLYGSELEVSFLKRLRGERKFKTAQALSAQMVADRDALLALIGKKRG